MKTKILLIGLLTLSALQAREWPVVSAEIWAMKEDQAKGIKDAVILENRTIFKTYSMERIIRIRILSEAGKMAARLPEFSGECHSFDGRTVYPDGKVLSFEARQDFQSVPVSVGNFEEKRTVLIPPGLTADCLVELRWVENTLLDWLPTRMGNWHYWRFGSEYYTLIESIKVPKKFRLSYTAMHGSLRLSVTESENDRDFWAKDIPATESELYSLSFFMDRPVFQAFYQPQRMFKTVKEGSSVYWKALGTKFYQGYFEDSI